MVEDEGVLRMEGEDAQRTQQSPWLKKAPPSLRQYVRLLESNDYVTRHNARMRLVDAGSVALPALAAALDSHNEQLRWEAAKAIAEMRLAMAGEALVRALEDECFGIRWIAAEGLISLGRQGLVPLLQALVERPWSVWLLQGAHHVVHDLFRFRGMRDLAPLLEALDGHEARVTVVLRAHGALAKLTGGTTLREAHQDLSRT